MVIKGLFIPCPRWWALVFLIGVQAMPLPAQEFGPRQGLLLGSGAISPGFMLHRSMTNIYVSGHLEYFVDEAVSIRGRGAWYVDAQQEPALLRENSQLSAGPWFHTGKGRLDLHAGFEPGISFTSLVIGTGRHVDVPPGGRDREISHALLERRIAYQLAGCIKETETAPTPLPDDGQVGARDLAKSGAHCTVGGALRANTR